MTHTRSPTTERNDWESIGLLALIAVAGLVPVVEVLVHGARFGAEASIGLLLAAGAIALIALDLLRRRRRASSTERNGDGDST